MQQLILITLLAVLVCQIFKERPAPQRKEGEETGSS